MLGPQSKQEQLLMGMLIPENVNNCTVQNKDLLASNMKIMQALRWAAATVSKQWAVLVFFPLGYVKIHT